MQTQDGGFLQDTLARFVWVGAESRRQQGFCCFSVYLARRGTICTDSLQLFEALVDNLSGEGGRPFTLSYETWDPVWDAVSRTRHRICFKVTRTAGGKVDGFSR